MKKISTLLGTLSLVASVAACSSSPSSPAAPSADAAAGAGGSATTAGRGVPAKPGSMTIVGIVLEDDGEFDVLQAAVVRADLVDALAGATQYTVFAPTDQAFADALGGGSEAAAITAVENLDVDTLTDILLFHVTPGRRTSTSVLAAPSYEMLNGDKLTRDQLSAAGIAATDVPASNGMVHVINDVLLPAS